MRNRLWLCSLVLLLFLSSTFALSLRISPQQVRREPGTCVQVRVVVTNNDDIALEDVAVILLTPPGIEATPSFTIGDLPAGSSTTLNIPICINENLSEGQYLVLFKTQGRYQSGTYLDSFTYTTATISFFVFRGPRFIISYGNISSDCSLPITISNTGGSARDVCLSVALPYSLAHQDKLYLGDFPTGESKSLVLNLTCNRALREGVLRIPVILTYSTKYGGKGKARIVITPVCELTFFPVYVSIPNVLKAKSRNRICFDVQTLDRPLEDVMLWVKNTKNITYLVLSHYPVRIPFVPVNETRRVCADGWVPLKPGVHRIPIAISFYEHGIRRGRAVQALARVVENAEPRIFADTRVENRQVVMGVTVANPSDYTIHGVWVRLSGSCFKDNATHNAQYVGDIDPGDFGTVQFKLSEQSYPCELRVFATYRVVGIAREINATFTLPPIPQEKKENFPPWLIPAGAALAGVFVLWRVFKK